MATSERRFLREEQTELGLVLTGGGARAAYQVGVLKGIAELLPRGARCPFPVITGTSAGAVSAVALASDAAHFRHAVYAIERVWRAFRVEQVFRADAASMLRSGLRWMLALASGGTLVKPPPAIFDNGPLWDLLRAKLDFGGIPRGLYKRHLHAIGINATSYSSADSVTFFAAQPQVQPWNLAFRGGARTQLTLEHLMASLSMPFLFRPIRLGEEYFGDGSMRQTSPLGPAIHMGASRLLVVGVGDPDVPGIGLRDPRCEPSIGQVFGFMLDSLFMDQLRADLERIARYNQAPDARHIDWMIITPSKDVGEIARRHRLELPRALRALLRTLGANQSAGTQLMSYLLFESGYTRELIALGEADAMARAPELREFLGVTVRAEQERRAGDAA